MVQTLSIRTKLIMAMLALVASVALMSVTADAANAAGVTEIRWVENNTPYPVYVWNHATGGWWSATVIPPNSAVSYNQRVPWATSPDEFNRGHYIELGWQGTSSGVPCLQGVRCPRLAIWQEGHNRQPYPGDFIRYSRCSFQGPSPCQYEPDARAMPGTSTTGGRRILVIKHIDDPTHPRRAIMVAGLRG